MANPIIFKRIKKLWDAGRLEAGALAFFVAAGLFTQAEADEITGVVPNE